MTSSNIALVIGEERQSAEAIERLLAPFGLTCLHVFDPEVASTRLDLQSVRLLVFSGARRCREGLDWAERLRAQPHGQFVYVVMLCGPQWPIDTPALPPGLVDQCVFEPLVEHGLITAALAAVRLGRLHKEFSSLSSELPGYKATLERDLFLLRQLQLSMMPKDKQLVAGTEVRLFSQPKTMLSGDQAGVFELGPDCLGFYLVDVVGHGMPAAVRALGFSRLFSGLPHESAAYREPLNADEPLVLRSSAEVMTVLNQVYQISDDDQAYVCAIYGVFNRQSRELDLCVAGMPLPYVVDPHGRQSALGQHDLPLGVVEQHVYTGTRVVLQPNESLLMVSDGVLEVPGPANALLGAEGLVKMLADCIKSHYHNLPDCLAHSIEAWAGRSRNVLFNDDATMIELNFDPPAVQVAAPHPVAVLAREAGLANPLSPGVIEQANRTFSGSAASQLNLARPVQRALLIVDQPGPCESLAQTLSSQGISVQSIAHNYFLTDGDPLFDGIDLVCLFASKHSLKAGKWIQLLADTCADEPPFVLVLHEGSDLAQARELSKLGADFFLPTPVHTAALTACLAYADRKNGIVRAMGQKAIELECVRAELLGDMEAVARMQLRTLPKPLEEFKQLNLDWVYRPAQFVSGDFLGVTKISESTIGFFAIDATGQGVLASIKGWAVARLLAGVLRIQQHEEGQLNVNAVKGLKALRSPAAVLRALNERILAMPAVYRLQCTLVYGTLDCITGEGMVAIAGHPQPVITQPNGSTALLGHVGPGVGSVRDVEYIDVSFGLRPGDRLHLYSDGLLNGVDPNATPDQQLVQVRRAFSKGASTPLQEAKGQWELPLNKRRLGEPKDVSLLMLELGEAPPIQNRDIKLTELFDRYLPLLDRLTTRSSFVQAGQVFEARYSESALIHLVQMVRDWSARNSAMLAEHADRIALLVYELGWNLRREKRKDCKELQLQVVVLQLPEHLAVLINDNGQALIDDMLDQGGSTDAMTVELNAPQIQAKLGLEMASQMADELRYHVGTQFNSLAAVVKHQ